MTEEKELIKKRGSIKGRITAFANHLTSLDASSLSSSEARELQLRIGKIESLYDQYDEVQLKIECSTDSSDLQASERTEFENHYYRILADAQGIIEPVTKESSVILKRVIDQLNKNLRALESLGQPIEHWDTLLIYIVTQK
ncbi:Uncharacterized protein OBRU01_09015, partial [Operophtera brumata]